MVAFVTPKPRADSLTDRCQPELVYELRRVRYIYSRRSILMTQVNDFWLTKREVTLLQGISEGLESKQIARQLGVAEKTIKNQLSKLYQEIEVPNRAAAAAFAVRHGIAS